MLFWKRNDPLVERARKRVRAKIGQAHVRVTGTTVIATERFPDIDGNVYRLEYRLQAGGNSTSAFCRHKPSFFFLFFHKKDYSFEECHLHDDGTICLGNPNVMAFERAVDRARFWANTYTFLIQRGLAEARRVVPEW